MKAFDKELSLLLFYHLLNRSLEPDNCYIIEYVYTYYYYFIVAEQKKKKNESLIKNRIKKKKNQSLSNSTLIAPLYSINYSSLVDFVEYSAIDGFW